MLALFVFSGTLTYWLAGGWECQEEASVPGIHLEAPPASAPVVPVYSIKSGPRGLLTFVQRLRRMSAPELRAAFLSTRNYPLRCAITARWAALDSGECFRTVRSAYDSAPYDFGLQWGVVPLLFEQWASVDPAAARDALAGCGDLKEAALNGVIYGSLEAGTGTWRAFLQDARFGMLNSYASNRPQLGAERCSLAEGMRLAKIALESGRTDMLSWVTRMAPGGGDMQAAVGVWQELPEKARRNFAGKLVRELVNQNPEQAAALVAGFDSRTREMVSTEYVYEWAKKDAAASWEWVMGNLHAQRVNAAASWASSVAPHKGAKVIETAVPSLARDAAGAALAENWLRKAPADAGAWIAAIEDPGMKSRIWQRAATVWAEQDPARAVEAFIAPGAPVLSGDLVKKIARQLVSSQPALAEKFAAGLPVQLSSAVREAISGK